MKRILAIACSLLLLIAGADAANAKNKPLKKTKAKYETVVFDSNLHCAKCVEKVEENIAFEKGVKDLEVSLDAQMIKVTYDPKKTSEDKLAGAIRRLGYSAEACCDCEECAAEENKE